MIEEDTLTLYYFHELDEKERRHVEEALQHDTVLAARYAKLQKDLDGLGSDPDTPAPSHLKHQWHAAIDSAAKLEVQRTRPSPRGLRPFAWGGALAAALVIGIAIGTLFDNGQPINGPDIITPGTSGGGVVMRAAFRRGLQLHLQEAEVELTNYSGAEQDDQSILLMQIIAQNRVFERAAENNNSPDVARLMRAFEPILLRLAEQDIAPEDAEALRKQLSFELKAMLTKIKQSPSEDAQSI